MFSVVAPSAQWAPIKEHFFNTLVVLLSFCLSVCLSLSLSLSNVFLNLVFFLSLRTLTKPQLTSALLPMGWLTWVTKHLKTLSVSHCLRKSRLLETSAFAAFSWPFFGKLWPCKRDSNFGLLAVAPWPCQPKVLGLGSIGEVERERERNKIQIKTLA